MNKMYYKSSYGSALVVVLWIIGLMSLLVTSMIFDANVEARITSYYRRRIRAEYLSNSGVEIAQFLMQKSVGLKKIEESEDQDKWWFTGAQKLAEGLAVRGMNKPLGVGNIILDIVPEPARRNVNTLTLEDWERVLEVAGVPEEMWPELIESVLDWIDQDNNKREDGAETDDYYATLDPPRRAKNGPLDTVGELLLVKGFSEPILYGGTIGADENGEGGISVSGIGDLLTTYGDGRVNVNAASKRILMTLPDVDDLVAGAIIEEREGREREGAEPEDNSFENVNDFMSRIQELNPSLRRHVTTDSMIFRIKSVGDVRGVRREVWCIVKYVQQALTILQWREED
ncbi:MAG: general secretion pathway protein GspK [Lentisphaerae bacterium]|nr:general secretion pathway protein GspK [Lentisphaerota bacterium]